MATAKFGEQAKFIYWQKLKLAVKLWLNCMTFNMEANSCVRGFHVYSDIWTPFVEETLACEQESGNLNDLYAVTIKKQHWSHALQHLLHSFPLRTFLFHPSELICVGIVLSLQCTGF